MGRPLATIVTAWLMVLGMGLTAMAWADEPTGCLVFAKKSWDSEDKQRITETVADYAETIRACYETALEIHPDLEGTLVAVFTIDIDGVVASAAIQEKTLASSSLEPCLLGVISTMAFPERAERGPVVVSFPFGFDTI